MGVDIYIRNWRDVQPKIAHLSAVHWGGLRPARGGDPDDNRDRLERLGGFARHALQGRKTSDHHKHENLEQVYYVLSGRGEVSLDGHRYPIRDGDALYLPSGIPHQMFNDGNDWLEHHVISQPVESNGGTFAICNWRQVAGQGDGAGAVCWQQLRSEESGGPLRGMAGIARESVQPGNSMGRRCEDELEQVYYGLKGEARLLVEGSEMAIREGDMIHLPPGIDYGIRNFSETEWASFLVMSA